MVAASAVAIAQLVAPSSGDSDVAVVVTNATPSLPIGTPIVVADQPIVTAAAPMATLAARVTIAPLVFTPPPTVALPLSTPIPQPIPAATPLPTPAPTAVSASAPTPRPTVRVTPQPPTVQRTPRPTPQPTPRPSATPPTSSELTARIPDGWFVGDFDGQGSGTYHGRSASWVYGQGTPYHTMTASFVLDDELEAVGRASLRIVGLDGENDPKNPVRIVLNGVTLYEGPNPLPNDYCCGGSGPGNWGSMVLEFSATLLARENSLSITNLAPSDCTSCTKFVMVDYAVLDYRVRS
jgi:hypothetical protein